MYTKFHIVRLIVIVVLPASLAYPIHGQTIPLTVPWSAREFQPNVKEGGRANGFAVHPTNDAIVFATSESGGLFRTADRGATWRHVDSLPCYRTASVTVLPADPNVVLVTTGSDYRAAGGGGGGVWRSTDGGTTWAQVTIVDPFGRRLSGSEIAVSPSTGAVFAGTSAGLAVSTDRGSTWTLRDPFGGNQAVNAVAVLSDGRVLAGGGLGISRSTDGGATWSISRTGPGSISDIHGLCRSPIRTLDAYAVNDATQLFRTEDGGVTWIQIDSAPVGGGGCGGIGFIKAVERFTGKFTFGVVLYFGNRCGVSRLVCPLNRLTNTVNYNLGWSALTVDHGDPRDLAFRNPTFADPRTDTYLLGSDGGIHRTDDREGDNWKFTGGGPGGFNALQITEVFGQTITDIGRHDLYYGTQDNNLYASGDGGVTWGNPQCCEGFFIDSVRQVSQAADSKITYVACAGCSNVISDPLFANSNGWNDVKPTGGNPRALGLKRHIQGVEKGMNFERGLALTTDLGVTWKQYATFPEDRLDLPKVSVAKGLLSLRGTTLYQAIRVGTDPTRGLSIDHFVRVFKSPILPGEASVRYPAMTGFGSLGINPTMFAWYEVFGVNPDDPNQLIAPDVINEKMMRTSDGGETWSEMTELTKLVTDNGRLKFRDGQFPIVSVVSFCPDNPSLVMVGTVEGGIFVSSDGGANWARVAGSERATLVSSIHWRTANDVIVSTYGRGLWRLTNQLVIRVPDLERWCRMPCQIWRFPDPRPDPPYERGVLVYDGVIQGVRVEGGRVREVFISPRSSVVHVISKDDQVSRVQKFLPNIKVTESTKHVGFKTAGAEPQPPQKDWVIKGLLLGADDQPVGVVYGSNAADMHFRQVEKLPEGRANRSRAADRPYVHVSTSAVNGGPVAMPGERVGVTGVRFPAGTEVVAVVDRKVVGEKIIVNVDGTFANKVPVPNSRGFHQIEFRRGDAEGAVIDAVTVLVKAIDQPKVKPDPDGPKKPLK